MTPIIRVLLQTVLPALITAAGTVLVAYVQLLKPESQAAVTTANEAKTIAMETAKYRPAGVWAVTNMSGLLGAGEHPLRFKQVVSSDFPTTGALLFPRDGYYRIDMALHLIQHHDVAQVGEGKIWLKHLPSDEYFAKNGEKDLSTVHTLTVAGIRYFKKGEELIVVFVGGGGTEARISMEPAESYLLISEINRGPSG